MYAFTVLLSYDYFLIICLLPPLSYPPPACLYLILYAWLKRSIPDNGYSEIPLCCEIVNIAHPFTEPVGGLV